MSNKQQQPSSSQSKGQAQAPSGSDHLFAYDERAVDALRDAKPWEKNNKYFGKVRISALAAMKMLKHALVGVDKGRKSGQKPLEIMGMCIGKPDGDTLIVTDVCALPVEGTETKVVADDATYSYMAQLMESMSERRKETFIGWYHSHPFDVETYSHCHLSATDVMTQTAFQNTLPFWCAIVVDPLRSIAKQEPEFGCFRCYPVSYEPTKNQCPDGTVIPEENARMTRWGVAHHRYYALEISYFMSGLGSRILDTMSRNSLWIRVLSSSSVMEQENRSRFPERVKNATAKLEGASGQQGGKSSKHDDLHNGAQSCCELALEQVKGHISQITKELMFNQVQRKAQQQQQQQQNAPPS